MQTTFKIQKENRDAFFVDMKLIYASNLFV